MHGTCIFNIHLLVCTGSIMKGKEIQTALVYTDHNHLKYFKTSNVPLIYHKHAIALPVVGHFQSQLD